LKQNTGIKLFKMQLTNHWVWIACA